MVFARNGFTFEKLSTMRYCCGVFLIFLLIGCVETKTQVPFATVDIETIYQDSIHIRAIDIVGNTLRYAGTKGTFGNIDLLSGKVMEGVEKYHTSIPEFRSIAHTSDDFFMLSIGNPALLYKTGEGGKMDLVYMEEGDGVFYDAMGFWNDDEGIAIGDSVDGCLSIITTRDGGQNWEKKICADLPKPIDDEGAFAASNTNIKTIGNNTWIATTKRIIYSSDTGKTWETATVPIDTSKPTSGVYSIDFYDENIGIAFGGDYTNPAESKNNKAMTKDGGKTWHSIGNGTSPGYRSCVQFIPNSGGKGIVALGFEGVDYSNDMGATWQHLSDESFYTLRFKNDSTAYAAGKHRIAKLTFK